MKKEKLSQKMIDLIRLCDILFSKPILSSFTGVGVLFLSVLVGYPVWISILLGFYMSALMMWILTYKND